MLKAFNFFDGRFRIANLRTTSRCVRTIARASEPEQGTSLGYRAERPAPPSQPRASLTGSKSTVVHRPLPADGPRQRQPDIRFAKKALGWEPTTTLENGLKPTIAYFDRLLSGGQ